MNQQQQPKQPDHPNQRDQSMTSMTSSRSTTPSTVPLAPHGWLAQHLPQRALTALAFLALGCLPACEGSGNRSNSGAVSSSQPSPRAAAESHASAKTGAGTSTNAGVGSAASADDRRPAAIWNDVVVEWSELRPRLAERSGSIVLEEYLLDRRLEQVLRERGLTLSAEQVANEERILLETLDASSARSADLLRELRHVQGLGAARWSDLLRRNAALRALVASEVRMSEDAVTAALDAAHGPKRTCRIIAANDVRSAEAIAAQVAAGSAFADLAVERSTDRSAERGGLLAPVSRLDPSYPTSFRNALWALAPGEVSAPVLLEHNWVIIKVEREVPADAAINDAAARERARIAVRRAQERLLMENYARSVLRDATNATIFDDALLESWRGRGQVRR